MPKPAREQSETQVLPDPALEKGSRRRFSTRIQAPSNCCFWGSTELSGLLARRYGSESASALTVHPADGGAVPVRSRPSASARKCSGLVRLGVVMTRIPR